MRGRWERQTRWGWHGWDDWYGQNSNDWDGRSPNDCDTRDLDTRDRLDWGKRSWDGDGSTKHGRTKTDCDGRSKTNCDGRDKTSCDGRSKTTCDGRDKANCDERNKTNSGDRENKDENRLKWTSQLPRPRPTIPRPGQPTTISKFSVGANVSASANPKKFVDGFDDCPWPDANENETNTRNKSLLHPPSPVGEIVPTGYWFDKSTFRCCYGPQWGNKSDENIASPRWAQCCVLQNWHVWLKCCFNCF